MKKIAAQTALTACVMFTVVMVWFTTMGYLFAGPSYGLNLTASVLGAAIGMAALQAFWFSGTLFKKLAYPARIAGYSATLLPVLALCAWGGQWLPADNVGAWIGFVLIYLLILAGITAGYAAYFKKTAGSYEQALERHRSQRDKR